MEKNLLLPFLTRFLESPFVQRLDMGLMDEESKVATLDLIVTYTIVKGMEEMGASYEEIKALL